MKYIINGRTYEFEKEDLDSMFIDEGEEGCCYRVRNYRDDFVMKIHHEDPEKVFLDEDTCKIMKEIKTERILLPNDLIYDQDGKYLGYTMDFIEYKRPKIRNLKIGKVVDEFYTLEKDVDKLSSNYVYIDDLRIFNTIFSNGIYICDPGSFSLAENNNQKRFAGYYNKKMINEYEIVEVIFNLLKFNKKEQELLKKVFLDNEEYVSDVIRLLGYDKEEIAKTYFKELVSR